MNDSRWAHGKSTWPFTSWFCVDSYAATSIAQKRKGVSHCSSCCKDSSCRRSSCCLQQKTGSLSSPNICHLPKYYEPSPLKSIFGGRCQRVKKKKNNNAILSSPFQGVWRDPNETQVGLRSWKEQCGGHGIWLSYLLTSFSAAHQRDSFCQKQHCPADSCRGQTCLIFVTVFKVLGANESLLTFHQACSIRLSCAIFQPLLPSSSLHTVLQFYKIFLVTQLHCPHRKSQFSMTKSEF